MPRRLSSGPFDSLLPARLQQSHQRPTSVARNICTIVRNALCNTLPSAATAAEGEATLLWFDRIPPPLDVMIKKVDKSYIGHVRAPSTLKVDAGQCRAFVNAIGETNPVYRDVDAARGAGFRDIPIPPTYLFCLQMMSAENAYAFYRELGIDVGRLLHGEQGFKYHLPIHVGDELTFHQKILDIQDKKNGAMTLLVQQTMVVNGEGRHVADLDQITIVRN